MRQELTQHCAECRDSALRSKYHLQTNQIPVQTYPGVTYPRVRQPLGINVDLTAVSFCRVNAEGLGYISTFCKPYVHTTVNVATFYTPDFLMFGLELNKPSLEGTLSRMKDNGYLFSIPGRLRWDVQPTVPSKFQIKKVTKRLFR